MNEQILEEASEWLVEFTAGAPKHSDRQAFDAWLRRSPEHVRAYLELLPIWKQGAVARFSRDAGPESLIAYARTEGNVVPFEERPRDRGVGVSVRSLGVPRRFAWAAGVAVALLAGAVLWTQVYGSTTYSTGVGEQHSVTLADGSVLQLNARTTLRTRLTGHERRVELVEGQALFQVAADSARPFIVHIDGTRVRAVGTQFDVSEQRKGTVVTVVDGRVAVSSGAASALLSAGEQVTVPRTPVTGLQSHAVNVAAVTAWTQRRLVFDGADLADAVEAFNRYNTRQLVIRDPALTAFPISGTFSSTNPASLVRFLELQPEIEVIATDKEFRIVRRR